MTLGGDAAGPRGTAGRDLLEVTGSVPGLRTRVNCFVRKGVKELVRPAACEEVARFGSTLDLIKAKLAVESLQSNLKDVALELSHGRSPTELSVLLSDYINLALEELGSASISIER